VPGHNLSAVCKVLAALAVLALAATPALAYVGPGADVAFISTAMTLLLWMLAALWAVLLWPFYAMLRVLRRRKDRPTTTPSLEAAPEEARAVSHTDS
jgi:hypothetical protein